MQRLDFEAARVWAGLDGDEMKNADLVSAAPEKTAERLGVYWKPARK
jgi:hypothetical protein